MAKFKEGESGNPEGRPKGSVSITSAIKRKLDETNPKSKRRYVDDIVDVMVEKAVKEKDFRVIREIWSHIDGYPRPSIADKDDSIMTIVYLPEPIARKNGIKPTLEVSSQSLERMGVLNQIDRVD